MCVCVCVQNYCRTYMGLHFLTPLMTTEGFPHTCSFCSISTPRPTGCSLCTRVPLAAPSGIQHPAAEPDPCPELDPAGPGLSLLRAPPALPGARRAQGSGAARRDGRCPAAPITPSHPFAPRLCQLHLPVPLLQEASHKFLAHKFLGFFVTGTGTRGRR